MYVASYVCIAMYVYYNTIIASNNNNNNNNSIVVYLVRGKGYECV